MHKILDVIKKVFTLKLSKKTIDNISFYSIIGFFIILLIPNMIIELRPYLYYYNIYFYDLLAFIPILVYVLINNIKNKTLHFSWDILIFGIFVFYVLMSSLFSNNISQTMWGTLSRREGFITFLMYYLIYLNAKPLASEKNIIKFINVSFGIGLFQFTYGIIQSLGNGWLPFISKFWKQMAYGLSTNPNFMGTYMMLLSIIGFGLILFYKKVNSYHKVCTCLFFIGMVLACSSGPFLSYCLILIIILLIFRLRKQSDKYHDRMVIWLAIFVSLYTIFNYGNIIINRDLYHNTTISDSSVISGDIKILTQEVINKTSKLFFNVEPLGVSSIKDDSIGSGRITAWKLCLQYVKNNNRIWFGTGPDNLSISVGSYTERNPESGLLTKYVTNYDRAHNVYLNYLVTTGIFSLITYLVWTIYINIVGIKNSKNNLVIILLLAFVGYNIQSILNINVIEVTVYYYLFTGLMMGLIKKN